MKLRTCTCLLVVVTSLATIGLAIAEVTKGGSLTKWRQGTGWGWVWGPEDEVGSLNEMTDASRLASLRLVREGKVFDLGVAYDRNSFKWPGHSPAEIMTFRSPDGVRRQGDFIPSKVSPRGTTWHSCALFMSDNVATQIDGLCHAVEGEDNDGITASRNRTGAATGARESVMRARYRRSLPEACLSM